MMGNYGREQTTGHSWRRHTWRRRGRLLLILLFGFLGAAAFAGPLQWRPVKGTWDHELTGVYGAPGIPAASNRMGARNGAATWTGADGKLYLFGGTGYDVSGQGGDLNDLWCYNPASGQWTWLKGSQTCGAADVYGTQGVPGPANTPGACVGAAAWTGANGKLYLLRADRSALWCYDPASGNWTWLGGHQESGQPGVYGTKGVADPANKPGARGKAMTWTGADGRLYLFGGFGYDGAGNYGYLNDLWRYDPASGYWTWITGSKDSAHTGSYGTQGVAGPANTPGARSKAMTWTGANGRLYLLGGFGYGEAGNNGFLNDLWSYDPASGQWTWLTGGKTISQPSVYGTGDMPATLSTPGSREAAAAWTGADGRLYLFGGFGSETFSGYLNDLWFYDPALGLWRWITKHDADMPFGIYGQQGVAAAGNRPGVRSAASAWTGPDGLFYLFGGRGYTIDLQDDDLADLWRYDPASGQWTWLAGSSGGGHAGIYGTQGTADAANTPGARTEGTTWTGPDRRLYLFGGSGQGEVNPYPYRGAMNDLWSYDPATGNWTWLKGSNEIYTDAVHGAAGQADPAYTPGARLSGSGWTGTDGRLYLFGGWGAGVGSQSGGTLNELWRYDLATGNWTWLKGGESSGHYGTKGVPDPANLPYDRAFASSWTGADGKLYLFGGDGYDITRKSGDLNDLWCYNSASGCWTWFKGSATANPGGVDDAQDAQNPGATPGGRANAMSWPGADGTLYLFGGWGYDCGHTWSELNDLWACSPPANAAAGWACYE